MWTNPNGNAVLDPYYLDPRFAPADWRELNGLTQVSPSLVAGKNTLNLVIIGDSLSSNIGSTAVSPPIYIPTNTSQFGARQLQMGNLWNGEVYMAREHIIGAGPPGLQASGSWVVHWAIRACDEILTAGTLDRIIIWCIAVGGARALDWAPGGSLHDRAIVTGRRLQSMRLDLAPIITYLCLGTNDCAGDEIAGNTVLSDGYYANMLALINACKANGLNGKFIVSRATWGGSPGHLLVGTNTVASANTSLALQANVAVGANFNSLNDTFRSDHVHWDFTNGMPAVSALAKTDILANL